MKKFGRKTTLNLRYGSDMGSHSVVSDWKGYDFMEIVENKETNADRIRNMTDEELAEWLTNMCDFEKNEEPYKSIYNLDTEKEEEIHDSYGDLLKWFQSEAGVIELKDETEIVKNGGVSDDVCKWKSVSDGEFIQNPHTKRLYSNEASMKNVYCNTCGKKIKVAE